MDKDKKIEFKKEYGRYKYVIINHYNLWNVELSILFLLNEAIIRFSFNDICSDIESHYILSELEEYYIDILLLKRLDHEMLHDTYKAIYDFMVFRTKKFENQEVFKEKLTILKKMKIKIYN